jgi:hypothetical protein
LRLHNYKLLPLLKAMARLRTTHYREVRSNGRL